MFLKKIIRKSKTVLPFHNRVCTNKTFILGNDFFNDFVTSEFIANIMYAL